MEKFESTNLKELRSKMRGTAGTKDSEFARIDNNYLVFKGKSYKICRVSPYCVEIDSDNFEGRFGDEFPLNKIM